MSEPTMPDKENPDVTTTEDVTSETAAPEVPEFEQPEESTEELTEELTEESSEDAPADPADPPKADATTTDDAHEIKDGEPAQSPVEAEKQVIDDIGKLSDKSMIQAPDPDEEVDVPNPLGGDVKITVSKDLAHFFDGSDAGEDKEPAQPTLTVPDLTLKQGDTDTTQQTSLKNSKGESHNCTGKITVKKGAPLEGKITMKMPDFFGAGKGAETVTWAASGADLVGTYPASGGFPIVDPLDGETTNHWSAAGDAAKATYDVTTQTLDSAGKELATVDWKLTVTS